MSNKITFAVSSIAAVGLFASALTAYAATPYVLNAKITGPNTVTIVFSEPVATHFGDYANFSGALSGRNMNALSGSGSNTVILTFDGSTFSPDANGALSVASTTLSTSDNSPFVGGSINITDGQTPVLSSITVSSNNANNALAKIGNVINISFSANETVTGPSITIAGHSVSVNGGGSGPYTASYTMASGDTEGTIPLTISFADVSGNTARTFLTLSNGITGTAPIIASITSNATSAGVLKIGDSITFTLTPSIVQPSVSVSGYYNGVPLSWSTSNGGATYTATYTVASGNNDQTSPLQINGVALSDQSGNTSSAASGSDVLKTIDAHAPIIGEVIAISSPTMNATPSYTFSSNEQGPITYRGDCSSQSTYAVVGLNTVTFSSLPNGTHNNCTIAVTDAAGNASNQLLVSSFTVGTGVSATPTPVPVANSSGAAFVFTRPLKIGSTGDEVSELQRRLASEGLYGGSITGYYGALTQSAVKVYQKKYKISQLGIVGPATRALLNR